MHQAALWHVVVLDRPVLDQGRLLLRAERSGIGNGRVYEIRFTADDGHGGRCTGSVQVKVLKGWAHPIDDGQKYDSTRP